jgi:hypothetical protein
MSDENSLLSAVQASIASEESKAEHSQETFLASANVKAEETHDIHPTEEPILNVPVRQESPVQVSNVQADKPSDVIPENMILEESPVQSVFSLADAVIDLDSIIVDDDVTEFKLHQAEGLFEEGAATTSVVCTKSAYSAQMLGLNMVNKTRMLASTDNLLEERRKFFKLVYDHISLMNIKKPSFELWLRITAFSDVETLCYGIYAQTYGSKAVEFNLNCGTASCKAETTIGVKAVDIARSEDTGIAGRINSILNLIKDIDGLKEHTLVGKPFRVLLSNSKIVIDFSTPSINDYLDMVNILGREVNLADLVSRVMFIKTLLLPDYHRFKATGKLNYFKITSKQKIFELLGQLGDEDGVQFDEESKKIFTKFEVNYKLPATTCTGCGTKIDSITVDMERMLFQRAAGKLKAK